MGYFVDTGLNINKETRYFDYPPYKRLNYNGQIYPYYNEKALANAFQIWLTSSLGENIRSYTGGVLDKHIGKEMNDKRADRIKKDIQNGADKEFRPKITFVDIQVIGDLINQVWKIYVAGYNEDYNIGFNTAFAVNAS